MYFKKPLKTFLFPAANILLAFFLLRVFFIAGLNVTQTFPIAAMNALNYLKPQPMDYFWELNIHNAPLNKSLVRYYRDYYVMLLKVFPSLRDVYGILGYCDHYLGDDVQAIDDLKKAILYDPSYSWNYYNLAAIYISQSRYEDAFNLLKELQSLSPQESLERLLASQNVYLHLLEPGGRALIHDVGKHLELSYKASFDLLQLLHQAPYDKNIEGVLKKMDLELYAF